MGEDELAVLRRALDLSGIGFILADPRLDDDPIVYVNHSFLDMTGYAADEVLGRNCRFLQGRDTDPGPVDELRRAVADGRPATVELRNYRRDGSAFWNEVHVAPVRDDRGEVVRFVGVQVDVTAHRRSSDCGSRRRTPSGGSTFLAEASPLLDASLDLRSTLDSLTRLSRAVPRRRLPRRRDPPRRGPPAVGRRRRPGGRAARARAARAATRRRRRPDRARARDRARGDARDAARRLRTDRDAAAAGRLRARGDARPAEGARDASSGVVVFASLDSGPPLRAERPRARRGPGPPRRARARQRAAVRGPRRGRARAAGRAAAAAAADARRASSSRRASGPPATAA